jgi:hypothetical protein
MKTYIKKYGKKFKTYYYKDGEIRKLDEVDMDLAFYLMRYAKGKEKVTNSGYLFERYGPSSMIRRRVHKLRLAGYPICSNTNGYYWADTSDELAETYMFLKSYIDELNQVAAGILDCYIEKRFGKKSE